MTHTALYQRLSTTGARLGSYNGAETALSFTGSAQELRVLASGCGVFDLGWRTKVVITGGDRLRWLNGVVTNNIKDLPVNHGNYNFLLNAQGRILADMYVYNRGEYLLVDSDRSELETILKTLDHFIIMDDVELSDSSDTLAAIGVCGPKAEEILSFTGFNPAGLGPMEVRDLVIGNMGVSVVRGPEQKPGWYEVWAGSDNSDAVWDNLMKAGAQPVGAEALELWRIAHGIPRYGQDIRERDLPQETEQSQALNFTKGCYIGQEIVERIRSRGQVHRKFTGFEFHDGLPQPGKVEEGGRVVAEITSVAEVGRKKIGLGYVRRETSRPGSQLQLNGISATVTDPPFQIE